MSNTRATSAAPATPTATRSRVLNVTLSVLQALLALAFAAVGLLKVSGAPEMVDLFTRIGAGQWLRYVVGALEIAGAIGLLIPRLSGLAALGLLCLMVGAIATNLFIIHESPVVAISYLLASALVALGRWPQTRALAGKLTR